MRKKREEKEEREKDFARNSTTRYGQVKKKLSSFCDFLLTGTPDPSILSRRFGERGSARRSESGMQLGSA